MLSSSEALATHLTPTILLGSYTLRKRIPYTRFYTQPLADSSAHISNSSFSQSPAGAALRPDRESFGSRAIGIQALKVLKTLAPSFPSFTLLPKFSGSLSPPAGSKGTPTERGDPNRKGCPGLVVLIVTKAWSLVWVTWTRLEQSQLARDGVLMGGLVLGCCLCWGLFAHMVALK